VVFFSVSKTFEDHRKKNIANNVLGTQEAKEQRSYLRHYGSLWLKRYLQATVAVVFSICWLNNHISNIAPVPPESVNLCFNLRSDGSRSTGTKGPTDTAMKSGKNLAVARGSQGSGLHPTSAKNGFCHMLEILIVVSF